MNRTTLRVAALGTSIAGVAASGIAFAAWTSSGTGAGTASSTTSVDSVIAASTHAADLYPGATKSVVVTVSNPNDYPILVTSITAGSSDKIGSGTVTQSAGCAAGTVTSDARTLDATGLLQSDGSTKTIQPHTTGSFTLVTHMAATATDGCKSQDFNLPLTATVVSNA